MSADPIPDSLSAAAPVASLDDRIYEIMPVTIPFSMKEIEEAFPSETYWPLYRALNRLEKQRKVRFYKIISKKKYYTKDSINTLPHILMSNGTPYPLSVFITNYEAFSDPERKIWKQLDVAKVNKIPILFGHLFTVANSEEFAEPKKMRNEWELVRDELIEARRSLSKATEWVDIVLEHSSMQGNIDLFKETFAGKDAPQYSLIQNFVRWVTNVWSKSNDNSSN